MFNDHSQIRVVHSANSKIQFNFFSFNSIRAIVKHFSWLSFDFAYTCIWSKRIAIYQNSKVNLIKSFWRNAPADIPWVYMSLMYRIHQKLTISFYGYVISEPCIYIRTTPVHPPLHLSFPYFASSAVPLVLASWSNGNHIFSVFCFLSILPFYWNTSRTFVIELSRLDHVSPLIYELPKTIKYSINSNM